MQALLEPVVEGMLGVAEAHCSMPRPLRQAALTPILELRIRLGGLVELHSLSDAEQQVATQCVVGQRNWCYSRKDPT